MTLKAIVLATLGTLALTDALGQAVGTQYWAPNLSGLYRCVHRCAVASFGHILADGWELTLTDRTGQAARAWIDRPGHIWVPSLSEGAVYSPDGTTIQFDRGGVWVLVSPEQLRIDERLRSLPRLAQFMTRKGSLRA